MHPEQIKAEIRMRQTTPAAIADELRVSRTAVGQVINGKATSARIAKHIAGLLGMPVTVLWPQKRKSGTGLRRVKGTAEGSRA